MDIFLYVATQGLGIATGIKWVCGRNADKYPEMNKIAFITKTAISNANRTAVKIPCPVLRQRDP